MTQGEADERMARELIAKMTRGFMPELEETLAFKRLRESQTKMIVELIREVRAERDEWLKRAMAVVDAAIVHCADVGLTKDLRIAETLVAQGFLTPDGKRVERG